MTIERDRQAMLHNQLAGEIVGSIVRPVIATGGRPSDVLVLLESVALGICLFIETTGSLADSPEALVDQLAAAVKERWAGQRADRRKAAH